MTRTVVSVLIDAGALFLEKIYQCSSADIVLCFVEADAAAVSVTHLNQQPHSTKSCRLQPSPQHSCLLLSPVLISSFLRTQYAALSLLFIVSEKEHRCTGDHHHHHQQQRWPLQTHMQGECLLLMPLAGQSIGCKEAGGQYQPVPTEQTNKRDAVC